MLGFPESTEVKQFIPKTAIYRKFGLERSRQAAFDKDIAKITIVNEISANTLKIADSGGNAFFVLEVALKKKNYDKTNIEKLIKLIDQNLLLVLTFENQARLALFWTILHESEWKPADKIKLELKGLDFAAMWENVVREIVSEQFLDESRRAEMAPESQNFWNNKLSLDENIKQKIEREKILKQIEKLAEKMKKEKQPNKKFELFEKIRALKQKIL